MKPIIIIGSGLAAYTVAREFRRLDKQTAITIICADNGNNYSKPMLSNAFARSKTADSLVMSTADNMQQTLTANIVCNTTVESINIQNQTVLTADNNYEYQYLVLATGANPIRLPLQGSAAAQVLAVNSLQDYAVFREAIKDKKDIAILGPGLIGCEFANDLIHGDYKVSIIGPDKTPMQQLIPEAAGEHLQLSLSELGVKWHLDTVVKTVDVCTDSENNANNNKILLTLENGASVKADVVLSAIGLRAVTQLASEAGIKTERGIVVNKTLQTSDNNVYALGDCAEVNGYFLPFVMPIMQCARVLAATLAAKTITPQVSDQTPVKQLSYPVMPVVIKTPACPIVVVPPENPTQGNWNINKNSEGIKALHLSNNGTSHEQLTGFVLTGSRISEKQSLLKEMDVIF